ncbi:uncharacterized protein LOC117870530 [Trachemys scripta elegans]|uniref:uncharacterized protein LOC117870530 n=1 Tax=Trachemys scripta elegans TaxID=31138 RepID=UPI00155321E5|nr:uncharacterized protein LOC117870530 [Trachemys scripta elegans]
MATVRDSAIVLILLFSSSMEDAVTQTQPALSGVERESVSLDCTYETAASNYYLYWYKQPPGESLNFLFRQYSGGAKRNEAGERFSVNLEKSKSSVSLRITALELGDAAMYFCAFSRDTVLKFLGSPEQKPDTSPLLNRPPPPPKYPEPHEPGVKKLHHKILFYLGSCIAHIIVVAFAPEDLETIYLTMNAPEILLWTTIAFLSLSSSQGQGSVTQTQGQLAKLGGQTVTLECTFSTGYPNYYLFWYRQHRSGAMDFLFRIDYSNTEKNGAGRRFSAQFRKSSKFFSLTIKELEPTDSALYFCALWEDTVRRLIGSPVQKPTRWAFSP